MREPNRIDNDAAEGSETAKRTLKAYSPVHQISIRSSGKGDSYEDHTNYGYRGKKS